MPAGRKPTPTALKLVKGNPGKRPLPKNEPKPLLCVPEAPFHLSDDAKAAYARFARIAFDMGTLTEADGTALERMAEVYAEVLRYRNLVANEGATFTSDSGLIKANPAVSMLSDADRRLRGYLVDFGMTPSARSKVQVISNGDEGQADPAAEFFG